MVGCFLDEPVVEGQHSNELPELALCLWSREVADLSHFAGQRRDSCRRDMVAEEVQLCHSQHALGLVDLDAVLGEAGEDLHEVVPVLADCRAGHQDIIYINETAGDSSQDLVHQSLAGLSGIPEPKWEHAAFIHPEWGGESSFGHIRGFDWDLVEGSLKV